MNAKEYNVRRRVILLDMATESDMNSRFDCIESTLSRLDALEMEYIKGDPVAEGSRSLRERYEDALEVVRKQALIIADLEAKASLFQQVMQASKTFVERFPGGHLTDTGTLTKFFEEVREFKTAGDLVMQSESDTRPMSMRLKTPHQLKRELAGEAFDVMVTMGGVMAYLGLEWPVIEEAMRTGIDKLDNRTTDDYTWYESIKQVAKKSKMGDAS